MLGCRAARGCGAWANSPKRGSGRASPGAQEGRLERCSHSPEGAFNSLHPQASCVTG